MKLERFLSQPLNREPDDLSNHVFVFQPETDTGWYFITVLHLPRELLRSWHRQLHRWLAGAK